MINFIWLFFLIVGIAYAGINGRVETVTQSAISGAETAVTLAFKLLGVMCLWLGIMKIAEKAGLIRIFAWILGPIIRLLFPGVPKGHPALGAIVMTVSANMLGLGNAATPFGIKAMQQLQELNPSRETATPAMCTLLALCTTGFTLVPATLIALRSAAGSVSPAEIVGVTVLTSLVATATALTADFLFRLVTGRRRG
ncbi:spore maturation protein [Anaerosporomusa subterranea]|uniref:Spore maturation protein n=1 Tax=Anaerosporomusa subterranea TaxID=1794912 RepID=A0A154BUA2_ANASB|nr:nucleoside recognition domain-containing protein [Anaerosporomusa subterranea]KYZ77477.1 spore maturation protein [Anaerosporomusa subterranea]MDF2501083.1 nucleoside recognition domain protein [Anaerosporomusa subterranea]